MGLPHVALKAGAGFPVLRPAGIRILAVLDQFARERSLNVIVSSGSEERGRAPDDPHALGEAVDVRVMHMPGSMIRELYYYCLDHLGSAFTVLLEAPPGSLLATLNDVVVRNPSATALHMHIQRKKGTTWPPI